MKKTEEIYGQSRCQEKTKETNIKYENEYSTL